MTWRSTGAWQPLAAAAMFGASVAGAAVPQICADPNTVAAEWQRAPQAVTEYFDSQGNQRFDQRTACARWAGMFYSRRGNRVDNVPASDSMPARFIVYPAAGISLQQLAFSLGRTSVVKGFETARNFLVVSFSARLSASRLREILDLPQVEYSEPDCDGPDFLTTSVELFDAPGPSPSCWQRAARRTFPNDPCIDENRLGLGDRGTFDAAQRRRAGFRDRRASRRPGQWSEHFLRRKRIASHARWRAQCALRGQWPLFPPRNGNGRNHRRSHG